MYNVNEIPLFVTIERAQSALYKALKKKKKEEEMGKIKPVTQEYSDTFYSQYISAHKAW